MFKLGIIGCNNMGGKHLQILRKHFAAEAEVVGILNSTPESTRAKAEQLKVPFFNSIDEITLDKVDGVIISSPGLSHAELGCQILRRGIPCLIEKPLATTHQECDSLIMAAQAGNTLILTGHTENYNPAVMALKRELTAPVKTIFAKRTSRNAGNATGISCIQELMIHDLAIINSLLGKEITGSKISKRQELSWENHAIAEMKYGNGAEVKLEALREDVEIERFMDIEDVAGNMFHIDFMKRSLSVNNNPISCVGDSLVNEHRNFLDCIQGEGKPLVSAEEARDIVDFCQVLEKKISIPANFISGYSFSR